MADINGTLLDLPAPSMTFGAPQSRNGMYQPLRVAQPVVLKVYNMRGLNPYTGAWVFWASPGRPALNAFAFPVLHPTVVGVFEQVVEQ